jgi:hypothetical protein
MSTAQRLLAQLDSISQHIWNIDLDESAHDNLNQKVSHLSAQLAVHRVFDVTLSLLLVNSSASLLKSRLSKFLEILYEKLDDPNERWQKLRSLDCAAFLFVTISYTPRDVSKMPRDDFDYLIGNAPKYLRLKQFPSKWMFCPAIQTALAEKANLDSLSQFRRGMS